MYKVMMDKLNGCIFWLDVFEKYNTIWDKVSTYIYSEPIYNREFLKTKINSHGDEVTDFYEKEITKLDFNHTYLTVISLDSALKKIETIIHQSF